MRSGSLTSWTIVAIATAIVASRFQAIAALAVLYLVILGSFGTVKWLRSRQHLNRSASEE